jgi:hypothetical protein
MGVIKPTLGTLLLVKDDESVSFLLKDSFHGWNIICSGVTITIYETRILNMQKVAIVKVDSFDYIYEDVEKGYSVTTHP